MIRWIILLLDLTPYVLSVVCSQCDSDTDYNCKDNPPPPQNCTACSGFDPITFECSSYYDMKFCIIERRYLNDTLVRITRDCSPLTLRSSCHIITEHGQLVKVCFSTCKTSGCNSSTGPSIFRIPLLTTFYMMMCVIYSVHLPVFKTDHG